MPYGKTTQIKCINCGVIRTAKRKDVKFCSNKCRSIYSNNKPKTEEQKKLIALNTRMWYLKTRSDEPERFIWLRTRRRARINNIPFNIDVEDIIIPKKCPLLGIDISFSKNLKYPTPNTPSLDKIDPKLGYTKGNVWIISYKANVMKQDADLETLRKFCTNVLTTITRFKNNKIEYKFLKD